MVRTTAPVTPGARWGRYPERAEDDRRARGRPAWSDPRAESRHAQIARDALLARDGWLALAPERFDAALQRLGARLAQRGWSGDDGVTALGCVAARLRQTMGLDVYATQLHCAAAMLDERLAEMATGEGKTVAAAIAAAVGALAGVPVHVLTANEYLAERDAQSLAPLYHSLGLTVAHAAERDTPDGRRTAYEADVTYATARVVAFDYLRDRMVRGHLRSDLELRMAQVGRSQGQGGLLLRGLCMAVLDEADSILLDEARMPLILAEARDDPEERARAWQSLDIAQRLEPVQHFTVQAEQPRVRLTEAGAAQATSLAADYGGVWMNRPHREERVLNALTALHALQRDVDYLVRDDEVLIIDPVTGRSAPGRVWSRGLHAVVALKEQLPVPAASLTRARITYPRLFARYHHLSGMSGTLREDQAELRRAYRLRVVAVPLRTPSRRQVEPTRLFRDRDARLQAALDRVRALAAAGRPVLAVTDSVLETRRLARRLAQSGLQAQVLDAQSEADEARIVAAAGEAGRITVATQMAGRGTDILLSAAARTAGGLHVLNLQHNRSRRHDRQAIGRAARQGDPGSCEHWVCADADALRDTAGARLLKWATRRAPGLFQQGPGAAILWATVQRMLAAEDLALRRQSRRSDGDWSRRLHFGSIAE